MGFNCLKAMGQLRGSDLLFTTNFPEIPGIWPKAGHGAWAVPNTSQIKKKSQISYYSAKCKSS